MKPPVDSHSVHASAGRFCRGTPPLRGRLAPWMQAWVLSGQLPTFVRDYESPVNLVSAEPFRENARQLSAAARQRNCELQIFFARKANKCLAFVQAARQCGIGVDTASLNEVDQTLALGLSPDRIICTAAVKSTELIDHCLDSAITVALDNDDELQLVDTRAQELDKIASVAIRLGGFQHAGAKLVSRFGFDVDRDRSLVSRLPERLKVAGVHFHLDGYDAAQRVSALTTSIEWIGSLRERGQRPSFIDMGGGFPVCYLEDPAEWEQFWTQHRAALLNQGPPVTYRNHALGLSRVNGNLAGSPNCYPYWQQPVGADWLAEILDGECNGMTMATALRKAAVELRCEPGRALLDGCGMTVAQIEFTKPASDGNRFVGLSMNRTQCRTTSDDFLVDPLLVPASVSPRPSPTSGYLVGTYCTEAEFILLRRFEFPYGVRRGDLIALPNTAGYLMHFLESRGHQFPLAKNLVVTDDPNQQVTPDEIDT